MIKITLPDGAERTIPAQTSGAELARQISPSLARRSIAMVVDGEVADLSDTLPDGAKVAFITRNDPPGLALIRHGAAHILAEAVQSLFPDTQVTIGPVIENGFYYDFARATPFTPSDLPRIEAKIDRKSVV